MVTPVQRFDQLAQQQLGLATVEHMFTLSKLCQSSGRVSVMMMLNYLQDIRDTNLAAPLWSAVILVDQFLSNFPNGQYGPALLAMSSLTDETLSASSRGYL